MPIQTIAGGNPPQESGRSHVSGKQFTPSTVFLLTLIAGVTALPFLPSLGYAFVYDDDAQIVINHSIQSWHGAAAYFISSKVFHGSAALMNYNY